MPVRALDYSALTEPVQRADIAAWRAQARASGAAWSRTTLPIAMVITIAWFAVLFFFVFGGVLWSFVTQGISTGNPAGILFPGLFLLMAGGVAATVARGRLNRGRRWEEWFRLDRFAAANGMRFRPMDVAPSYPGEIFHLGGEQTVVEHLIASGRFLDIGNFRYVTGSGRSQVTHDWGFLALYLDRAMPNIVLDAKANNSMFSSNLPIALDKKQILHLEGDFDQYFTLYCPAEYEQDALYIFTPDLMALLIDEASPFDVELVDQWMFVYASRPFAMTDPAVLQRLFTIADTVGAKAVSQTAHYADDRIGDFDANLVSLRGARLRRRVPVVVEVLVIAFFVGFLVFWGWKVFSSFV